MVKFTTSDTTIYNRLCVMLLMSDATRFLQNLMHRSPVHMLVQILNASLLEQQFPWLNALPLGFQD